MASKKQQVVIYVLVGIMLLGVVGTAVALIFDDGSSDNKDNTEELVDLARCMPTPSFEDTKPIPAPEKPVVIKDKVTELKTVDIKEGSGAAVKPGDCIVVHYQGSLANSGIVFDSSYKAGQPITISLDQVIGGWQEGVPGMKVGGIRRLIIPSNLGYGEAGSPPDIGPNMPLVFVVEVVEIKDTTSK